MHGENNGVWARRREPGAGNRTLLAARMLAPSMARSQCDSDGASVAHSVPRFPLTKQSLQTDAGQVRLGAIRQQRAPPPERAPPKITRNSDPPPFF